jgi:hypothetical protein
MDSSGSEFKAVGGFYNKAKKVISSTFLVWHEALLQRMSE